MPGCPACRRWLPREAFRPSDRYRDGLSSRCQRCSADATRAWRERNRDEINARRRETTAALTPCSSVPARSAASR